MAGFRFDQFRGIRPRISKRKLPPGEAQTALNTKLGSGDIEYWDETGLVGNVADPYNNRTIFLYEDYVQGRSYWFEWSNFVDVARAPIRGDTYDRVYYTGDGTPKMTYNTLQSTPPYPTVAYELGVPAPTTRLTAVGQTLPEDVPTGDRRTSIAAGEKLRTANFEIVSVDFTLYPGTGTPNDTWRILTGTTGNIIFQVQPGDTFRVLEVLSEDVVTLGSALGTGAIAATAANDKTSTSYWHPMDEQGSTQAADFIGWRVPDGMLATIPGHLLRVGDVIRVTRLDLTYGFSWSWPTTSDLFELADDGGAGGWGVPSQDTDGIYRHENVLLGKNSTGTNLFELNGGFFYDVDRTSSDNDVLEDRTYVYTYVSSVGEEGPPSLPSSLVQAVDGDTVTLTGFNLAPDGFRNIDRVRIYRTNATSVGTEFQFVKEASFAEIQATGEVVDNVEAASLGEIIATTTWFPPPTGMQGIVSMPNGMMVGFNGKNIYFAEPYQPHAWPPEYDQAVDFEVIALAPFGNSVAVLTTGTPYVITGSHPRNVNIRPYKINQACLYKESVALAQDRVYYASPDGLVEIGVNGARLTTGPYVWKKEWEQFQPALMVGEFHDGKYYGFYGADNTVTPQPTASVAATGTLLTDIETFEEDIVAGGKTIILTLTNDTWAAAGADFDAVRDDILFSITSNRSEILGWNNIVTDIAVTSVARTSNTQVTITLPAIPTYSISANEILTFKAPALALAGQIGLTAPETTEILADSIYSTEAIVTTNASTTAPLVPELLVSDQNVANWIRISAPGGIVAADSTDLTDAAYLKWLNRWVVIGYETGDNDRSVVFTSDNVDNSGDWVSRYNTSLPRAQTIIYEDIAQVCYIGGDGWIRWTQDGINFINVGLPTSVAGKQINGFARAPEGSAPYVYGIFSDAKNIIRSANIATQPLSTAWTDIDSPATAGTGHAAIASGNGLVYIANSTEIGFYVQGGTTYTKIGDLTGTITGLVYGGGRLVAITDDGRVQYADAPNETTIGNWSTQSSPIDGAGLGSGAKIEYDAGDGDLTGYKFIVTLSGFGGTPGDYRVYTSPDAISWTLRDTVANTSDALGIGVKNPEFDLSGTAGVSVNLSGATIFFWESATTVNPVSKLIIRADGTIDKQRDSYAPVQLSPLTDWVIPNFLVSLATYHVRITNVTWTSGSATNWVSQAAANDTWVQVTGDLTWSVQGGNVRFTLEISDDAGSTTLASAEYTLGSNVYTDPRFDWDFDYRYWYYDRRYHIP